MAALLSTRPFYQCSSFSLILLGRSLAFPFLRSRLSLVCSQSNFSRRLWTRSNFSPFFSLASGWTPTSLRPCWSTCGLRCFRAWKSSTRTEAHFLCHQVQIFACQLHLFRTSYALTNHCSSFCGNGTSSFSWWSDCWSTSSSDTQSAPPSWTLLEWTETSA